MSLPTTRQGNVSLFLNFSDMSMPDCFVTVDSKGVETPFEIGDSATDQFFFQVLSAIAQAVANVAKEIRPALTVICCLHVKAIQKAFITRQRVNLQR
jgi:hypothetical protein